ncbi:hypothetical protein E1295_00320 [Nonomuraea mesophila]|uniref:Uncharacterized protein n=1 Tax=Nonomuraea mesophila TaxID=2530382 RepID=A0A4R5FYT7_9ACTN|nr:hypothetical protein [Nonomuraea mesophila]TDE60326.1 hypothetical protein E1295_00320 [Nonomuraea mesophila]
MERARCPALTAASASNRGNPSRRFSSRLIATQADTSQPGRRSVAAPSARSSTGTTAVQSLTRSSTRGVPV